MRAEWGASARVRALVLGFLCSACVRLLLSILNATSTTGGAHCGAAPPGSSIAILSGSSGRYVEVGSDGWLHAVSFSPDKPAARFDVVDAPPALVHALLSAREFREVHAPDEARPRWDMRPGASSALPSTGVSAGLTDEGEVPPATFGFAVPDDAMPADVECAPWVLLRSEVRLQGPSLS